MKIYILFILSLIVFLRLKRIEYRFDFLANPHQPVSGIKAIYFKHLRTKIAWLRKTADTPLSTIRIAGGLAKVVGMFCVVAGIFSLLQIWLEYTAFPDTATATILMIEEAQFKAQSFLKYFKMGFLYNLVWITVLVVLGEMFTFVTRWKLKKITMAYTRISGMWLAVLTMSTSFTFFGHEFAAKEKGLKGRLERHELEIVANNKLLRKEIRKKVSDIVINVLLKNPEVAASLAQAAQTQSGFNRTVLSSGYKDMAGIATDKMKREWYSTRFEKSCLPEPVISHAGDQLTEVLQKTNKQNETKDYKAFKNSNALFDESNSNVTLNAIEEMRQTFESGAKESVTLLSPYYIKYHEPVSKVVSWFYSETVGKVIDKALSVLRADFALADQFVDPLLNDPLRAMVLKKVDAIFRFSVAGDAPSIRRELDEVRVFAAENIAKGVHSEKFKVFKAKVFAGLQKVNQVAARTKAEFDNIRSEVKARMDKFPKGHFEQVRVEFGEQFKRGEITMSEAHRMELAQFFKEWEACRMSYVIRNGDYNAKELETEFYNFCKVLFTQRAAIWEYILQLQGFDGITAFAKKHKGYLKGTEHLFLKYYCGATGNIELRSFENLAHSADLMPFELAWKPKQQIEDLYGTVAPKSTKYWETEQEKIGKRKKIAKKPGKGRGR